jgi:hypothetical protein
MALGRLTSGVLQLLGLIGLIVCIALAVGILAGRAWIGVTVGDGFTTVDTTITNGLAKVDDAKARLTDGGGRLDQLLTDLGPLPATSPIPAAVSARITELVDAASPARDTLVEARSQAQVAISYLQLLHQLVPNIEVPDRVSTALTSVDERLTQVDTAIASMRSAARATAGDVAAAATSMRDAVKNAADSATNLRGGVEDLQARLVDVHAGVDRVLWVGAGGLLILVGYVALLNVLVIWLARRGRRAAAVDRGPALAEATPGS